MGSVSCHPRLPLILSAFENGTVRPWHSTTYRPETTLNHVLERAWTLQTTSNSSSRAHQPLSNSASRAPRKTYLFLAFWTLFRTGICHQAARQTVA